MPQMAPLNWAFISPFSLLILLLVSIIIYFNFYPQINEKNKLTMNSHLPKFKW